VVVKFMPMTPHALNVRAQLVFAREVYSREQDSV